MGVFGTIRHREGYDSGFERRVSFPTRCLRVTFAAFAVFLASGRRGLPTGQDIASGTPNLNLSDSSATCILGISMRVGLSRHHTCHARREANPETPDVAGALLRIE